MSVLVVTCLVVYGCADGVSPSKRTQSGLSPNIIWEENFSWEPDTTITNFAQSGSDTTGTGALPLWQGESFDETTMDAAQTYCPVMVRNPSIAADVWLPSGQMEKVFFDLVGFANYIGDIGRSGLFRVANYTFPPGTHTDWTGWYRISGATTLTGICKTWRLRTPNGYVEGGAMTWVWFDGSISRASEDPGQSGNNAYPAGRGWAYDDYRDISVKIQNGAPSGWEAALDAYFDHGRCTAGWDIWVDNRQVCWA